jgi:UDP:flavonoid glycosyltransferase YjiC (YdhE family)
MAHFLLLPVGSHGDVHPFIGLGVGLKRRGHRVTVVTAEPFRGVAERHGLEFEGTVSTEDYNRLTNHPDLWKPSKGLRVVLDNDLMRLHLPVAFAAIRERYVPGDTVAVGGSLAFVGRVAHEALGIPFATVHLQPMSCCSVADPPVAANGTDVTWLPRPLIRLAYRVAEWRITDPLIAPPVNEFRRTLGLPPVKRILTRTGPSPQRVLGFFPDWFGPIPDGGPNFRHSGFVFFDDANGRQTPEPLVRFLDAGPPPVVFSFGSAMRNGRPYFDAAAEACRRLHVRGVLLGKSGEQIPPTLPPGVMHADYAPFSEVFPRAACVVHHGGVGTSAQAMRAGVPQLVMPMAYDQADNAARLRRVGVSRTLFPKRFTGPRVGELLNELLKDERVKQAARQVGDRLRTADGVATACSLVEELVGSETRSGSIHA